MRLAMVLLLAVCAAAGDLESIRSDSNLERRSDRAIANANRAISDARDAYGAGQMDRVKSEIQEAAESVELSYESLKQTGKNPRQTPKHFKRAELSVREMLRRLK